MMDQSWLCEQALFDKYLAEAVVMCRRDDAIGRWRQTESVVAVTDNTYPTYGKTYWEIAKYLGGDFLLSKMDAFVKLEEALPPRTTIPCDQWSLSPALCRHILRAIELDKLFKLEGRQIVEIGGGWGGLCAAVSILYRPASYTICDMPYIMRAQKRALAHAGITAALFTKNFFPSAGGLLVSDHAFSELTHQGRDAYGSRIGRFGNGALMCPSHLGTHRLLSPDEMCDKLRHWVPGATVEWGPEIPHYRELLRKFGDPRCVDAYIWKKP